MGADKHVSATFEERYAGALAEHDYTFARELLDLVRDNEIDDERYHYERLRLLMVAGDEDGFYQYFYKIEAGLPDFAFAMQTRISQLVVQVAQR